MVIASASVLLGLVSAVLAARGVERRRQRRSRVAHVEGAAPVRRR
jgi:ABC-type spermidine/putrescine transport system permease subunit II